jgi:hypothetical protein
MLKAVAQENTIVKILEKTSNAPQLLVHMFGLMLRIIQALRKL